MPRIALMEDYLDHARTLACVQQLAQRAELQIHTTRAASEDELVARLAGVDAVITIRDRVLFSAAVLERLRGVQLIAVCGPRLAPHIDLPAATRAGILVAAAHANEVPRLIHRATAELNWSLILGLAKGLPDNDANTRRGAWQQRLPLGLAGKTLGVVGIGKVGAVVTAIGVAMGMRVIAWSPRLTPERAAGHGAEAVPLDVLLREADVVSLHANLTPESTGMIDADALASMKPGALLVNTARAALIDEAALRTALQRGALVGVGLDVYWQEPLPAGHWLTTEPRALLAPHLGGFTHEGYAYLVPPAVETVLAYLDGRPIAAANPEAAAARGR